MVVRLQAGPLLAGVLAAEEQADCALRYPLLVSYADAVLDVARQLERPLLIPVGADGQRLLGAVEVRCEGEYEQYGWQTSVAGRNVLLVAVTGVSGLEVSAAAESARRLRAREVHACAVDAAVGKGVQLDSFIELEPRPTKRKRRTA
jgi:hypothetical protein